jgi:uncharacterized protein (TIGR04255 family)
VIRRPADLPEFDNPPVVEVAIGVQFEPVNGFRQAHLGLFWNQIREDYPKTQDQPRLETALESFDAGGWPTLQLELVDGPPVHRAWFISENDELLLQVQNDRLIHNWRHQGGAYPRFDLLLDRFWQHVERFEGVLAEAGLTGKPIQQAEITYINWIAVTSMDTFFRPSIAAELDLAGIGPLPDAQRWAAQYPVQLEEEVQGRLAVEAQPGQRVEDGKLANGFQLSLAFRGSVAPGSDKKATSVLLELGRSSIVRAFAALTTDSMHEEWGRTK